MASWYTAYGALYESHFIAFDPINSIPVGYLGDAEGNAVNGHFPVEISEDGNTITVKPMVHSGISYYPNAALYFGGNQYSMSVKVVSEVVLTRKSAASAAPAKVVRQRGKFENERVRSNQKINTPARPASRTAITPSTEVKFVEGEMNLTKEQRGERWFETRRGARRN
jgi:hypothetical protein